MKRWSPHLYKIYGKKNKKDDKLIENALNQADILQNRNLPVVLTLGHLARHTDIPYQTLRKLVARQVNAYRIFRIRKRSSGYRVICVPNKDLLKVQRWIDKFILSNLESSPYSYAFEEGQSIVDCASQHLSCRWLIKIDLRNFFESLSEIQVYRVFKVAGYNNLVSFEMARLCTKQSKSGWKLYNPYWKSYPREKIPLYNADVIGHLPQGAPTSPKLSNLIMKNLDFEVNNIAQKFSLVYTRYADDMIFSTIDSSFDYKKAKCFIKDIFNILPKHGLLPNRQKTKIIPPGGRKIVLGLLVDSEKVRLPKDFRNKLECHWYYCTKDITQHAEKRGFKSYLSMQYYIKGLISFARQVDSDFVEKLKKKYGEIKWL
ncbi:RNA-directed DNA polymerase [Desulfonauticus submarinus]|uniref:RNA-directed DNA polymerase n=1 Tax=Desulfonauticus submarinus TaxID=206665 RepID=A0A1H0A2V0_9BACT|nr:reverse transcriptase family protein [Desulfonauticus submarinus]SDN27717.1 RNA-directed DNA polymerase [Desulfonauticus submarinus]